MGKGNQARRVLAVPDQQRPDLLTKQQALRERVRQTKTYEQLSDYEHKLLNTALLSPSDYNRYIEHVKQHSVLTIKRKDLDTLYKTFMGAEAKAAVKKNIVISNGLNGLLAVVEIMNLYHAYEQWQQDKTSYDKMNFLGCLLDTAAGLEALAVSLSKVPPIAAAAPQAFNAVRTFTPLARAAAVATMFWFGSETWRTAYQNRGDDVMYANFLQAAGGAFGVVSVVSSGALALATGGLGIVLLLSGTFLANYVLRENSDQLEYVLARGPFGAEKGVLAQMGFEAVKFATMDNDIEIEFDSRSRIRVTQGSYIFKEIVNITGMRIPANLISHSGTI